MRHHRRNWLISLSLRRPLDSTAQTAWPRLDRHRRIHRARHGHHRQPRGRDLWLCVDVGGRLLGNRHPGAARDGCPARHRRPRGARRRAAIHVPAPRRAIRCDRVGAVCDSRGQRRVRDGQHQRGGHGARHRLRVGRSNLRAGHRSLRLDSARRRCVPGHRKSADRAGGRHEHHVPGDRRPGSPLPRRVAAQPGHSPPARGIAHHGDRPHRHDRGALQPVSSRGRGAEEMVRR